ncbi:uncharacterized protein [Lepeophtheirus salmonis]|uniref:uncharacterized protein n=1 Tax=Lepeophtheirus salmonis TaxID=72036 RepID=UPI001AE26AA7|nr:uncharacterized protein LOC121119836 [Lepeophtheirus salmonis]
MLKAALLLACVLLGVNANESLHLNGPILPITGQQAKPLSIEEDDIPVNEEDLPKELLDSLGKDEIIEEIVVNIDNQKHVVNLQKKIFEDDAIHVPSDPIEEQKLINELLAEAARDSEENPRSADLSFTDGEKDRQSLNKEDILDLLGDVRDLDRFVPSNRESVRSSSSESLEGLTRGIFVDEGNLPGIEQEDGTRCIKKFVFVEETEYERGMKCQHSFKKKCHLTYITDYTSAPEKKCETTFKKNCHITFKPTPHTEKVKKCYTPIVQNCEGKEGPKVCKTKYENHCETQYKSYELEQDVPKCEMKEELRCKNETVNLLHIPHDDEDRRGDNLPTNGAFAVKEVCEKWPTQKCKVEKKKVTKVHPKTECKKIPREVCSSSNCLFEPGEEICHEESQTQIQNIPEEDCDLEPEENCREESVLVPKLIPKNNCVKVPKEICVNTKSNPQIVKRPIIKDWCYKPDDLKKQSEKL